MINERLKKLYPDQAEFLEDKIQALITRWQKEISSDYPWVNEKDAVLITYGDAFMNEGEAPLRSLKTFADLHLKNLISTIHILPMFPYTSDDGFSVSDFKKVNPDFGDWSDIESLGENFDLMFDAVINHASVASVYFKEYLKGTPEYEHFFISADPGKDYSDVTRPRALPLLTEFETSKGIRHVWTTFSEDQVDFNYKDPNVLLEILDILLLYVSKGARFIRFDAIGFAWKKDGTNCMHLPETHELVKLMREVIELCAKGATIITETNVPHKDNISYFGNGYDEAGLVYQFPLPPLTLHSFLTGDASALTTWAGSLESTTSATTYFNFLASHDGIGMRPVEGILTEQEISLMVNAVLERGGHVSSRTLPDGSEAPYELNINYFSALTGKMEDQELAVRKFMSAQCVLLSIMGMPAIYYHSLVGSRNHEGAYESSGIKRRINREKLKLDNLMEEIRDPQSIRNKVFSEFRHMLTVRRNEKSFHPNSPQEVLIWDKKLFVLRRGERNKILVLVNVSEETVEVKESFEGFDILSGREYKNSAILKPYEYLWIRLGEEERE